MGNKNAAHGPQEPGTTLSRGSKGLGGRKTIARKQGNSSPSSLPKSYVDVVPIPETPSKSESERTGSERGKCFVLFVCCVCVCACMCVCVCVCVCVCGAYVHGVLFYI